MKASPIPPQAAHYINRLLNGIPADALDHADLPEPLNGLAAKLAEPNGRSRREIFEKHIEGLDNAADIRGVIFADDPTALNQVNPRSWADLDGAIGPICFAWPGWLAQGMLAILAAPSGIGKSLVALCIAATFLRGDHWPDGSSYAGPPGAVLWCETEAAQALNLERARSWGLPMGLIYTPLDDPLADAHFDSEDHRAAIEAIAKRDDVRLVVVDSLSGGSRLDENKSEAASATFWLAALARDTGKPVLCLHHLRKRGAFDTDERPTLDMLRGHSSIIQPARLIWTLDSPDRSIPERKRLSVIKSNIGRFPDPIGIVAVDDQGVRFGDAPQAPRTETQVDRACDLLKTLLAKGPRRQPTIDEEANGAGLSMDTMRRAKQKLGIITKKKGTQGWYWELPTR